MWLTAAAPTWFQALQLLNPPLPSTCHKPWQIPARQGKKQACQWSPPRQPPASKCWNRDLNLVKLEPGLAALLPTSPWQIIQHPEKDRTGILGTTTDLMSLLLQQRLTCTHPYLSAHTHPPLHRQIRTSCSLTATQSRQQSLGDRTTAGGLLALSPPQMLSQALFSFQEGLQAAPAHADPSSLAGQGTTGLSCQAPLSPASSLASNGAHPPVLFPCSVHIKS